MVCPDEEVWSFVGQQLANKEDHFPRPTFADRLHGLGIRGYIEQTTQIQWRRRYSNIGAPQGAELGRIDVRISKNTPCPSEQLGKSSAPNVEVRRELRVDNVKERCRRNVVVDENELFAPLLEKLGHSPVPNADMVDDDVSPTSVFRRRILLDPADGSEHASIDMYGVDVGFNDSSERVADAERALSHCIAGGSGGDDLIDMDHRVAVTR
jgi:hypothetical protein